MGIQDSHPILWESFKGKPKGTFISKNHCTFLGLWFLGILWLGMLFLGMFKKLFGNILIFYEYILKFKILLQEMLFLGMFKKLFGNI